MGPFEGMVETIVRPGQVKANRVIMNKTNHLIHDGKVWVPMREVTARDLNDALLTFGDTTIRVTWTGATDSTIDRERKSYDRRIAKLKDFTFSGWNHVAGYQYEGTLQRK